MANRNNKPINDNTTDFFLKVMQKEQKEKKVNINEESKLTIVTEKTTKTLGFFQRISNDISRLVDWIFTNNKTALVVSLVMSVILFVMVTGGNIFTSPTSGTTVEDVPVVIKGLDEKYDISGVEDTVELGLIGPSLDIYGATLTNNFETYVDVSGLGIGEHNVKVNVKNVPDTLTVMVSPQTFTVTISPKISQTFSLEYAFINEDQMKEGYSASVNEMAISSVTVRSSEATIQQIASVKACIDCTNVTEDFEQDAVIKAYNDKGKELDVDIAPTTVHVKCSVAKYSKEVPVKVNYIGELSDGYSITEVHMSINNVVIYGKQSIVDKIKEVTVNVNIDRLTETKAFSKLKIKKPAGINRMSSDTVDVTLELSEEATRTYDDIMIQVLNLKEGKKVSFEDGDTASIKVSGSQDLIDTLSKDDIVVTIDVGQLDDGKYQVELKADGINENLTYKFNSKSKISIEIGGEE